jgi:succinyl-diaminopimelate desuccinylase
MTSVDPIELAQALIRRPSVTPADAGAMDVVEQALAGLGFVCRRMAFGGIENLYARLGTASPNLCFGGHTDVVPVGDADAWRQGPFDGTVVDGVLFGRGAVDMKGGIAAFVGAVSSVLQEGPLAGSVSLIITGDEEGSFHEGAKGVVAALLKSGEGIDHCVVGEPTSSAVLGDMIKVGRRGSLNAVITAQGVQGHVAYPYRAANPIPVLVRLLAKLQARQLDDGYPEFQPTNLEVTDLEVGNPAENVIPARARAMLNIRFNPTWQGAELVAWLQSACEEAQAEFPEGSGATVTVTTRISGEAFYTAPGPFVTTVAQAVQEVTGVAPELSTSGGTSDARYFRALCPVVEFGLVGTTMHMVDERTPVSELQALTRIYTAMIERYFETFRAA